MLNPDIHQMSCCVMSAFTEGVRSNDARVNDIQKNHLGFCALLSATAWLVHLMTCCCHSRIYNVTP